MKEKAPKLTSLACTIDTLRDFNALKRDYEQKLKRDVPMYELMGIVYDLVKDM